MLRHRLMPALLALVASGPVGSEENASIADAVMAGEAQVALRYRFEHVDQDGFADDANASTLRLRLNYLTSAWRGWRAFGEFDYVGEPLFDEFNSGGGTSPDRTRYPLVADPKGADLNQLYTDYDTPSLHLRLGRQRILLDDQRFVGGVGWRQNEQTFDAVSVTTTALANADVFYAWIGNANRIFGDTVPAGDQRMSTHLLNVGLRVNDELGVTPYAYYIDNDDDPAASTATLGVRINAKHGAGRGTLSWLAEFANQSDAANAPVDFDARYWHLEGRWQPSGNWPAPSLGVASLGGDRTATGAAFRTPLATLHAFQGWADQFLVTPDAGVVDIYGSLGYERRQWTFEATYHDFSAEDGGASFGHELDISATRPLDSRHVLTFKAAFFDGETAGFTDTVKVWLMVSAAY